MRKEEGYDLHYLMEDQLTSWAKNGKESTSQRTRKVRRKIRGRTCRRKYEGKQSLYGDIDQEDKGVHELDSDSTLELLKEDGVEPVEVVEEESGDSIKDIYLDEERGGCIDPVGIYLKEMGDRVFS